MKELLAFNDILISPTFSTISSRKDVSLDTKFCGMSLSLPIISSNMDTVTDSDMAIAMIDNGAVGALHRFQSIEENVKEFLRCGPKVIVSVGISEKELDRAKALHKVGARQFLVDVANGSSLDVTFFIKKLRNLVGMNSYIIVGNFATGTSVKQFLYTINNDDVKIDAIKVGIGGGSACLTRVITGCGWPTLASIIDIRAITSLPIIADGGMKTSGDIAKALAAGANVVMLGNMLAGTEESASKIIPLYEDGALQTDEYYKEYRGSASQESYEAQGKVAPHRSYEGDSFLVPCVGPLKGVLQQIGGGLRSALSYTNSSTLDEFRENAELVRVSYNGYVEGGSDADT